MPVIFFWSFGEQSSDMVQYLQTASQRAYNAIITSLKRHNDITTPFGRNGDVIIASCVRWEVAGCQLISGVNMNNVINTWRYKYIFIFTNI